MHPIMRMQWTDSSSSGACLNLDERDRPVNFFIASKSASVLIVSCTDLSATSLSIWSGEKVIWGKIN